VSDLSEKERDDRFAQEDDCVQLRGMSEDVREGLSSQERKGPKKGKMIFFIAEANLERSGTFPFVGKDLPVFVRW